MSATPAQILAVLRKREIEVVVDGDEVILGRGLAGPVTLPLEELVQDRSAEIILQLQIEELTAPDIRTWHQVCVRSSPTTTPPSPEPWKHPTSPDGP
jgi:hypothetical protein